MNKQNLNKIQDEVEEKYKKKEKRKKSSMKVSGASIKNLQKIIKKEK